MIKILAGLEEATTSTTIRMVFEKMDKNDTNHIIRIHSPMNLSTMTIAFTLPIVTLTRFQISVSSLIRFLQTIIKIKFAKGRSSAKHLRETSVKS
jgi:hypothetical protein